MELKELIDTIPCGIQVLDENENIVRLAFLRIENNFGLWVVTYEFIDGNEIGVGCPYNALKDALEVVYSWIKKNCKIVIKNGTTYATIEESKLKEKYDNYE